MNIGMMQISNSMINAKPATSNHATISSTHSTTKNNSFGDVFNKAIGSSSTDKIAPVNEGATESIDFEKLETLLESQSMEEVMDLLGIPHDEGLLIIQVGENAQAIAFDELMNSESLLSILNIEPNQLFETLQQLTGVESNETDLWQIINDVLQQGPEIMQQLKLALQGEQKVTPKQAEQLLQFLKLTQVTGKNSDLFQSQTIVLEQLNELMKNVVKEISQNLQNKALTTQNTNQTIQQIETMASSKLSIQGFEQVIQKVIKQTESSESTEISKIQNTVTPVTTNTIKTVAITLPIEKGAQSQALANEIQNVLNRGQISTTQGTTKILLKLYPENLGSIRIEIMQQDGVLTARLLTSTSLGKELLDSQLQQLKTAFAQSNIQMDRIDIAQSLQETDRSLKDQNQFGQQFKQRSEQDENEQDELEEESEKMSFSDFLINEEV